MTGRLSDEELAELIGSIVDRRTDLDDVAALALAQSLAVPCRACDQPAGYLCVRATDGKPLERFLAHTVRVTDAGAQLGFTDPRELGGPVHCQRPDCRRCRPAPAGHGYPVPDDDPGADQGWYRP